MATDTDTNTGIGIGMILILGISGTLEDVDGGEEMEVSEANILVSILRFLKKITFAMMVLYLASCASLSPYKVPILQGNIFDEDDIEKLSEGLSKEQVQFIFGNALIKDPFRSNRWDYYYSVKVGNKILDESKLSIFFNQDGAVDSWIIENLSDN